MQAVIECGAVTERNKSANPDNPNVYMTITEYDMVGDTSHVYKVTVPPELDTKDVVLGDKYRFLVEITGRVWGRDQSLTLHDMKAQPVASAPNGGAAAPGGAPPAKKAA